MLAAVFGVALVVLAGWGVEGYLWAHCSAAGIAATASVVIVARLYGFHWQWPMVTQVLAFGAPLVPHLLSIWVLSVSDRVVLERYVTKADLGLYGVAYSFAMISWFLGGAIDRAFFPMFTRKLKNEEPPEDVARIGSYILVILTWVSLGTAVLAPDFIRLVTTAPFHGAAELVPILVLGLAFGQLSQLWTKSIYLEKRTRSLGVATTAAAALNIGLNFWLIPLYGVVAAAWTTVAAYAFQSVVHGWIAQTRGSGGSTVAGFTCRSWPVWSSSGRSCSADRTGSRWFRAVRFAHSVSPYSSWRAGSFVRTNGGPGGRSSVAEPGGA